MEKIGIISDIHSNIEALNAVLLDMEKKGVTKIICLGDIVTKYIYPKEVVEAIKESCDIVVRGNCDDNVVNNENFKFARSKLGLDNIEYLSTLPLKEQLIYQKFILNFFHATPSNNDRKFNPEEETNAEEMLIGKAPQINFTGHTHVPYMYEISENGLMIPKPTVALINSNNTYLLNAGSVGEPNVKNRNQDSENNWLIGENMNYILLDVDKDKATAEIIKVPYHNLLIKIYNDFISKQRPNKEGERYYPRSPKDTEKIHESLKAMGEETILSPKTIDKPKTR